MKLRLIIILMLIGGNLVAQNKPQRFYSPGMKYVLQFYDGEFYEGEYSRDLVVFPYEYTLRREISRGIYVRKNSFYILTSSSPYGRIDSTQCEEHVINNDSLIIDINSPYEKCIEQRPLSAIYCYSIKIECGDDYENREYQTSFNAAHCCDTLGKIHVYKPMNVSIKKINILVYLRYRHEHSYTNYNKYPEVRSSYETKQSSNVFCFTFPNLHYFSLTSAYYNGYMVKKLNHRQILFHGEIYQKIKTLTRIRRPKFNSRHR